MQTELIKQLNQILEEFPEYWDGEALQRVMVINDIREKKPSLVKALIENSKIKSLYSTEVEGVLIFDFELLISLLRYKEYWANSFTKYRNSIGLTSEGKYLNYNTDVVLDFPFKDCVLEGGMMKEEQGKNEVYYNEKIARDEIDRLFSPKVLAHAKRYTKDGIAENITEFSDDDNLIIKGNNLIALHSLKERYANKVKLIYIDPPYNPPSNNNTFKYNNRFNHSTWLSFMKNRIEIAKQLLTDDGAFIIAIDENEVHYLGVMIDELFPECENHCVTIVHNPRGIQGTNFSYTHEYAFFIFPKGKKIIGNKIINEEDIKFSNLRNWGAESERCDAKNCFYPIIVDKGNNQIVDFGSVCNEREHPPINIHKGNYVEIYPVDQNGIERKWRYARQTVESIKHLLKIKAIKNVYDVQIGKNFGSYKTVWIDKRYDANEYGTQIVNDLVPNNKFTFPKSLWNVYDCIYAVVGNDKDAIILDYHAGSGTTAHAVLELNKKDGGNRKFIMIEQMNYIESVTCERVNKVIEMNNIKNTFIYAELMEFNYSYIHEIEKAQSYDELLTLFERMEKTAHLNYQIELGKVINTEYEIDGLKQLVKFSELALNEQKQLLIGLLDKNQLYVNANDMNDSDLQVSEQDKAFTNSFYGKV